MEGPTLLVFLALLTLATPCISSFTYLWQDKVTCDYGNRLRPVLDRSGKNE